MSEDRVPYAVTPSTPLESDEGAARTALRRINHWLNDTGYLTGAEAMEQMLRAIKRDVATTLARPRSDGARIDQLEEELGKLRGQLIDQRLFGPPKVEEKPATKLIVLESGSDWTDAGYEVLVVPVDLNIPKAYSEFEADESVAEAALFSNYLCEKHGACWPEFLETYAGEDDR